eukprot:4139963-Pyramimonas_sp.AAC.2
MDTHELARVFWPLRRQVVRAHAHCVCACVWVLDASACCTYGRWRRTRSASCRPEQSRTGSVDTADSAFSCPARQSTPGKAQRQVVRRRKRVELET